MKKLFLLLCTVLLLSQSTSTAQSVAINEDGKKPAPSAILDLQSTKKGLLIPRMTSGQRLMIAKPAIGLVVFDTDTKSVWNHNGDKWVNMGGTSSMASATDVLWAKDDKGNIYNTNEGDVHITSNFLELQGRKNGDPILRFGVGTDENHPISGEAIASIRTGENKWGLDFYTGFKKRMSMTFGGDLELYGENNGEPTLGALRFGVGSGEAIASKRTAEGNQYGLDFYTEGLNRMSIKQNGNVGIGTTDPLAKLDMAGGNWDLEKTEGDLRIGNSDYRLKIGIALGGRGAGDVRVRPVGGTNRIMVGVDDAITIAGNGSVGIGVGTATPESRLEVRRGDGNYQIAKFTNSATTGDQTALIDIQNGKGVVWRYGVGGTGNGKGINNDQFYIERSGANTAFLTITPEGNIGIGKINPDTKLVVDGTIKSTEVRCETTVMSREVKVKTDWADYVFDEDFSLRSLADVEHFIHTNKHLPEIPSAKEIQQNGLSLGEMQTKMMKKIEELTLYLIEANKQIEQLKLETKQLQAQK